MKKLCEGLEALTSALEKDLNEIESEIRSIRNDVNRL